MKAKVRELKKAVPFRAFIIEMNDGRTIPVGDPDSVLASPKENTWVIVAEEDAMHHLAPAHIRSVRVAPDVGVAA